MLNLRFLFVVVGRFWVFVVVGVRSCRVIMSSVVSSWREIFGIVLECCCGCYLGLLLLGGCFVILIVELSEVRVLCERKIVYELGILVEF